MTIEIIDDQIKLHLNEGQPGAVTEDGIQTLNNKTIALGSNTVAGTKAQFNAALTDGDFLFSGDAQPIDADLTAIAALAGTAGLLKKTAANTWELDTTSYSTLALGTSAGAALAASGAAGSATTAAKSDHVHPLPTAANVGAEPAITKSIGFAKWTGSAWSFDNSTYLTSAAIGSTVQAYAANLTSWAALSPSSKQDAQSVTGLVKSSGTTRSAATAGTDYVAPGGALGTPSSGNLSNCTADGTSPVGFRNVPQNSQSANYTCVLADAGDHILHPSADTTARTFTIPANSSVAFPIGTAITFVNQNGAGVVTISITTDTMRLAGAGTTGSRTLAANGIATAVKVASTEWIISGVGLT